MSLLNHLIKLELQVPTLIEVVGCLGLCIPGLAFGLGFSKVLRMFDPTHPRATRREHCGWRWDTDKTTDMEVRR